MIISDAKRSLQLARGWREKNSEYGGVVVVCGDRVVKWIGRIRNPESWKPGAIAVDQYGQIWITKGGDDYHGAVEWAFVDAWRGDDIGETVDDRWIKYRVYGRLNLRTKERRPDLFDTWTRHHMTVVRTAGRIDDAFTRPSIAWARGERYVDHVRLAINTEAGVEGAPGRERIMSFLREIANPDNEWEYGDGSSMSKDMANFLSWVERRPR